MPCYLTPVAVTCSKYPTFSDIVIYLGSENYNMKSHEKKLNQKLILLQNAVLKLFIETN